MGRRMSGENSGAYIKYVSRSTPEIGCTRFLKGEEYQKEF